MVTGPHKNRRGKVALFAAGCVVPFLLIELVLQTLAFASWVDLRRLESDFRPPREGPQVRRVLCVGDSFTFGTGARSPARESYPARLEYWLHQQDPSSPLEWQVFNHGWPGRNSAELVTLLPGLLREIRPHHVCILTGTNNRWNPRGSGETEAAGADTDEPASDPRAWHWKLRSMDLVRLVRDALERGQDPVPEDGVDRSIGLDEEPPPEWPEPGEVGEPPDDEGSDEPGAATSPWLDELRQIRDQLTRQDLGGVEARLRELIPRVQSADHRATSEELVRQLTRARLRHEAIEVGMQAIARFGRSYWLCGYLIEPLTKVGRVDEAVACANAARKLEVTKQAWLYRAAALAYLEAKDYSSALDSILQAFAVEPNLAAVRNVMTRMKLQRMGDASFEAALQRRDLSGPQKQLLRNLHGELRARSPQVLSGPLQEDLRTLVRLCAQSGAEATVLTYPSIQPTPFVQEAVLQLREEGVRTIDLQALLSRLQEDTPHEQLFVEDGHCTAYGYDRVARHIADALRDFETNER